MPELLACTPFDASAGLYPADPGMAPLAQGGEFLPFEPAGPWGIYDAAGNSVDGTVDLHGLHMQRPGQPMTLGRPRPAALRRAPAGCYLYGGQIKRHYGHFIVNTLARLWPLIRGVQPGTKVVFHGAGPLKTWFAQPFIACIFHSLGLAPDGVATFAEPTLIEDLLIARPAFQERQFVHRVFGEMAAVIGRRVLGARLAAAEGLPVYLSKTRLASGVGRVVNEAIIEDRLRRAGVDIVYPETLSFADQLALFATRPCIMGFASSAFHTGLFCRPAGRVIVIAPHGKPNPNFYLMDQAAGFAAEYYGVSGTRLVDQASFSTPSGFLANHEVAHPEAIADELIEMARAAPRLVRGV